MSTLDEDQFVKAICAQLDASNAQLDPALVTRLDQMRKAALAVQFAHTGNAAHDTLLQDIRDTLQSAPELSPVLVSRLDAARKLAVAKMRQRQASPVRRLLARLVFEISGVLDMSKLARPANMLATACVMVTAISLFYVSSRPAGNLLLEEEIVLIASADDLELYENLDFYLWLAENGLPN